MMPVKGSGHGCKGTPEYVSWVAMRQRCSNPHGHDAIYYAGVTCCPEWDDFTRFLSDMGKRPGGTYQIDRVDNTLGYSKDNCRWVDRKTQMRNTRISKWWFVDGVRYASTGEAATQLGVSVSRIKAWCDGRSDGGYVYPPRPNCWSEKKYES